MPAMDGNQGHTASSDPATLEQDFPASSSLGATVNEDMMMPEETLAILEVEYEANDSENPSEQDNWEAMTNQETPNPDEGGMEAVREYLTKIYKGIQNRPLPFVLGAAGVGFICGRLLGAASRPQNVAL